MSGFSQLQDTFFNLPQALTLQCLSITTTTLQQVPSRLLQVSFVFCFVVIKYYLAVLEIKRCRLTFKYDSNIILYIAFFRYFIYFLQPLTRGTYDRKV